MNWWKRLTRPAVMEAQLEKELRFELEQRAADLIAQGADAADAQRRAQISLGGAEQVKEGCRDARGVRWLADFWQDFRYALRMLRQKPGFAAISLATLALGIGATTIMFTLVDRVLLKPLAYRDPARLVGLYGRSPGWNVTLYGEQNLAYLDFLDVRNQSRTLDIAGSFISDGAMSDPGQAEHVEEFEVTSNFFTTLGVPPAAGREFSAAEDQPGGARVAILGYSLWQRRFAGDRNVIGSAVTIDRQRFTIVGIADAALRVRGSEPDVYLPLGQDPLPLLRNRRPHPIGAIARLRPGATIEQAKTELAAIGGRLAAQYPASNRERTFLALPLRPNVRGVESTLWLLLGAVGVVLLIACVNIAGLMLARAVSREKELAMRVALGAGRFRLVRQCLTESAVLALAGGALGVGLAALGLKPFVALWPGSLPRAAEVAIDWRVLLFVLGISLASGMLFGLGPALRSPVRRFEAVLRGARTVGSGSRRLHGVFVASEIALAMALLVSAAMLGRTLLRLIAVDTGVDYRNVLTARMALSPATLAEPAKIRAAWRDILDRARHVPGVEAATLVDTVPLRAGSNSLGYSTAPNSLPEEKRPIVMATSVTPDYLRVMGIHLLAGRFFDEHDRMGNEPVAVVDTVMAQAAFPGEDALGKRVWLATDTEPMRVVGIVNHVRYWGAAADDQAKVRAQLYYPFAQVQDDRQRRWSELMSIAVRTGIDPLSVVETLRREVRGAGNDQVLYEVQTMEQLLRDSLGQQRFLLQLFGFFAALALALACIGIYGVLAYLTGQRVPEIGVRMALGASARSVICMVLRQSLAMVSVGALAGIAGAWAAGRTIEGLVSGVKPLDLGTFAITVPLLFAAAMAASFVPARRASRVNPIRALRQE
jgi:predicted permease